MGTEPSLYENDLDVNGWVETLQLALARAGHHVDVDGKFGHDTAAAVMVFQRQHELDHDGVVGNQTWAALMERDPEPPGVNNGPFGGLHPHRAPAADPGPTAPPGTGPTVAGDVPAGPSAGPYAGTPYEDVWAHGYAVGLAEPDTAHDPPPVYDDAAQKVWLAGVAAGQDATHAQSDATPQQPRPQVGEDDAQLGPEQGLPTMRINVPDLPLATVVVETPTAILTITGGLQGSASIAVGPPQTGLLTSVAQSGYREEVRAQLEGLFSGIRINNIAGGITQGEMSIGTTWGNQFVTNEVRMITPTHIRYLGSGNLNGQQIPTSQGDANLSGSFGFYIDLEITPIPQQVEEEEHWYESAWDWVSDHAGEIVVGAIVIGVVVLVPESGPLVLKFVPG